MSNFNTIEYKDDNLILLNQTKLPLVEEYIQTDDYERIALAIEKLEVRGAPAIGIAAAYAFALAFKTINENRNDYFKQVYNRLASTRPTAVNLFWALEKMKIVFEKNVNSNNLYSILLNAAIEIHRDDIVKCDLIGKNGLEIFTKKMNVLTHCNTGKLATGGDGTAFNVIKYGFQNDKIIHVYADETRPLLQGSRLTAFELDKSNIPFTIITDSTAAFLMKQQKVDLVVVGADRIALNGDTANKIGTYNLAVLCKFHNVPFYIAAPVTTIDQNCQDGNDIKIELRSKDEIIKVNGIPISKDTYNVYSPAFDVTPAELISGIITDAGLFNYPYDFTSIKN